MSICALVRWVARGELGLVVGCGVRLVVDFIFADFDFVVLAFCFDVIEVLDFCFVLSRADLDSGFDTGLDFVVFFVAVARTDLDFGAALVFAFA